jgi:hypothetical protein
MSNEYVINKIKKTRNVHSLFFNEVDPLVRTKEEEFLSNGEKSLGLKPDKENPIHYSYNSLGFRSDEFTTNHDGKHILFAGCSETEGAGGGLESLWAKIVYDELEKDNKLSGFFNLGRSGWGHEIIVSNIMSYIDLYGKPDTVYMLFPNIGRYFEWVGTDEQGDCYKYLGSVPNSSDISDIDSKWKRKITISEQRSLLISFIMIIKLFEKYCESSGINLIWSTWDHEDAMNYKNLSIFKNYRHMISAEDFVKQNKDFFMDNIYTNKYWERKRDNHSGYLFHYVWAQEFLGRIDKKE